MIPIVKLKSVLMLSFSLLASEVFSQVPSTNRIRDHLTSLVSLIKSGPLLIDELSEIRDQGQIGSCASFGFVGLLENELFWEQGVRIDLSERYQVYSNYMVLRNLGDQEKGIGRYPEIITSQGVLLEELYPYEQLNRNASNFGLDSAQGLSEVGRPAIDAAIEGLAGAKLSDVLQSDEYFGPLPQGEFPIRIPVEVKEIASHQKLFVEVEDKNTKTSYPCFSTNKEAVRATLDLSPQEFAKHCLQHDKDQYAFCSSGLNATDMLTNQAKIDEKMFCDSSVVRDQVALLIADHNRQVVNLAALANLAHHSVWLAMRVPMETKSRVNPFWTLADSGATGAGHAVLLLGYVSFHDLSDPKEHLAKNSFLRLRFDHAAKLLDPEYVAPNAQAAVEEMIQIRKASKLADLLEREGGLFLFRNSWSARVTVGGQELVIGDDGYQYISFAYLAGNISLLGTKKFKINGSDLLLTNTCPKFGDVPLSEPWLKENTASVMEKGIAPLINELRAGICK